jgi:hypothetical protein
MKNKHQPDYEVGYGKPPMKRRWKQGQSGNPKGRPNGAKNLATVVHEEAYSKVTIKVDGKTSQVTKLEALFKSMMAKAIKGDTKAAGIALALLKEYLSHADLALADLKSLTEEEQKVLFNHAEFLAILEDVADDNTDE